MSLEWTWVGQDGPFLKTGEIRETLKASSETESESITATMFNLDSLNESRLEVQLGPTEKSQNL